MCATCPQSIGTPANRSAQVPACDALGLPFPIKLTEPRPVDLNGLPSCVFALCLSDLDALTLSLFELFTLQLREGSKHGQHEIARRRVGVDFLLMADERYPFGGECVDNVQQALCGAS